MTLRQLKPGQKGMITEIRNEGAVKRRLIDMGLTPGAIISVERVAPLGDPIKVKIRGYDLSLRREEAGYILVKRLP